MEEKQTGQILIRHRVLEMVLKMVQREILEQNNQDLVGYLAEQKEILNILLTVLESLVVRKL